MILSKGDMALLRLPSIAGTPDMVSSQLSCITCVMRGPKAYWGFRLIYLEWAIVKRPPNCRQKCVLGGVPIGSIEGLDKSIQQWVLGVCRH
jgi:hypothetical protein